MNHMMRSSGSHDAEFMKWMEQVDRLAARKGYKPVANRMAFDFGPWRDLFEKGMTPKEAWDSM